MDGSQQAQYLYCIIRAQTPVEFPFPGVHGDRERVHTILEGALGAVVSDARASIYHLTRSTAMAHQTVIQEVMREHTVLPCSFGVVADSAKQVRMLLAKHQEELLDQLRHLDGRAEYGVRALWRDKEQPFQEILAEREDIRRSRDALARKPATLKTREQVELGRQVQEALATKREAEAQRIMDRLRPLAVDSRANAALMDQMILNAAFLLVQGSEPAFEEALTALDREYQDRVRVRLVGPAAPFNFVHMPIAWE
ncbi:MAG: GvpL/GvpF family gas vesicle protein [Chloroflexi bacterium]|nr:GvpL/GvpF family gas vesicle protein [Chloroflexota bacterium]